MKDKNEKQFLTEDFYLAAFCLASDLNLLSIDKSNPRRFSFVFQDCEKREKMVADFLFGRARVEPKKFVSAIKDLKQLLHQSYE